MGGAIAVNQPTEPTRNKPMVAPSEVHYLNRNELLAKLNIGSRAFRNAIQLHPDFPQRDPVLKKWFWPEVKAYLLAVHGVSGRAFMCDETEKENWE